MIYDVFIQIFIINKLKRVTLILAELLNKGHRKQAPDLFLEMSYRYDL